MNYFFKFIIFAFVLCLSSLYSSEKTVLLLIENNSDNPELNSKINSLKSLAIAKLANIGYSVVDYNLAIKSLNEYINNNPDEASTAKNLKDGIENNSLSQKLMNDSSGLNIAKMLGTDFIFNLSISNFGYETKVSTAYNLNTTNNVYSMGMSYVVFDNASAATVAGDSVSASVVYPQSLNLQTHTNMIVDRLFEIQVDSMAQSLINAQTLANLPEPSPLKVGKLIVNFYIDDLTIPNVFHDGDSYFVSNDMLPVSIKFVNADIDGVLQTLGDKVVSLPKGLHTLKINQKNISPMEKNIFVIGGEEVQEISLSLTISDEARQNWKDDLEFVQEIKKKAISADSIKTLSDAQAKKLEGIAEMYEQSGFKVDTKSLPSTTKVQSIFGQ